VGDPRAPALDQIVHQRHDLSACLDRDADELDAQAGPSRAAVEVDDLAPQRADRPVAAPEVEPDLARGEAITSARNEPQRRGAQSEYFSRGDIEVFCKLNLEGGFLILFDPISGTAVPAEKLLTDYTRRGALRRRREPLDFRSVILREILRELELVSSHRQNSSHR
jgi:hypothetical protein